MRGVLDWLGDVSPIMLQPVRNGHTVTCYVQKVASQQYMKSWDLREVPEVGISNLSTSRRLRHDDGSITVDLTLESSRMLLVKDARHESRCLQF
jgi:hypothetical protein